MKRSEVGGKSFCEFVGGLFARKDGHQFIPMPVAFRLKPPCRFTAAPVSTYPSNPGHQNPLSRSAAFSWPLCAIVRFLVTYLPRKFHHLAFSLMLLPTTSAPPLSKTMPSRLYGVLMRTGGRNPLLSCAYISIALPRSRICAPHLALM